jgi:hypothetical protein
VRLGAVLAGKTLGQNQVDEHGIRHRERGREEKWRSVRDLAHHSANERTERESQTKSGADHSHGVRPLFRSGDIRDVGLRDGNVSPRDARQNSRDEKQHERLRHSHQRKTDSGAGDAYEQNRTAAESIGKLAQNRREDDLHPGINSGEPADRQRGRVKILGVERENRDDDAKAHEVDEDCEVKDEER